MSEIDDVLSNPANQLHDLSDFGTFGRFVETPAAEMPADMRAAYDFTRELRDMVPGPHKIWLANPALSRAIVPTGAYFHAYASLSKAEIEIVTALTTGRWLSTYANYEHEKIGVLLGGLDPRTVSRMLGGLPVSFDDARQQVVYELATTLLQPRTVPIHLYRTAKDLLGDEGIVDVTILIGWFTGVALTLTAYDVPADALGLDQ